AVVVTVVGEPVLRGGVARGRKPLLDRSFAILVAGSAEASIEHRAKRGRGVFVAVEIEDLDTARGAPKAGDEASKGGADESGTASTIKKAHHRSIVAPPSSGHRLGSADVLVAGVDLGAADCTDTQVGALRRSIRTGAIVHEAVAYAGDQIGARVGR